jgi:hypothetical protein
VLSGQLTAYSETTTATLRHGAHGGLTLDAADVNLYPPGCQMEVDVTERSARAQTVHRYEMELGRLQARLDVLYDDRLDGRIDVITYDRKAEEIRGNQQRVRTKIAQCQPAAFAPATKAVDLISLTSRAAERFERQCASEQRRLLRLVLQEAIWQNGELRTCFREPFEQLRLSNAATIIKEGHFSANEANSDIWRRGGDSNPR